jgi:hypothetical protein
MLPVAYLNDRKFSFMPYNELKAPSVDVSPEQDEKRRRLRNYVAGDLIGLLDFAQRNGFIITVETVPLDPLAMRNYRMVGNVRAAR